MYSSIPLNTTLTNTIETLCHDTFCCNFNISVKENTSAITTENFYKYRLVAYSGIRSFSGMYNGGIEICGVIFCQNSTHIESCGYRFSNYSTISWPIIFEHIEIVANFTDIHTKQQYPNSLLSHIRPIYPNSTVWTEVKYEKEEIVERSFALVESQKRLLTFAIYGRDFARDSNPFAAGASKMSLPVCIGGLAISIFILLLV